MLRLLRKNGALLLRRIDEFLFPPLCLICDSPRPAGDRWLCTGCREKLTGQIATRNSCPRCGQNRDFRICACDVAWDFPFSRIFSFVDYDDAVQAVMHQIKYKGKVKFAFYLGTLCREYYRQPQSAEPECMVLPIPLHWLRKQKRGYNQAEWFARGLFCNSSSHVIATDVLKRVRNTRTQTKLDRSQRRRNLTGAFRLTPRGTSRIAGKTVVLVDDVITTGATTAAAATVLLEGGCAGVSVVSFARD